MPAVVALILTCAVQLPLAGILAPVNERLVAPTAGENVAEVQVVLAAVGFATSKPDGNASLNWTPVKAMPFGLLSVKVKVDVPLTTIGLTEKALVMVGGKTDEQPVKVILSRLRSAPTFLLAAPRP
jgi:hypothetical protein